MSQTPFRTALTRLAALDVTGVTQYGIDEIPETVARGLLPVLLVLPSDPQNDRLFKDYGDGFRSIAFSGGPRTASVAVTHLLLQAPVMARTGARAHFPALIDRVDAYMAALSADVLLSDALVEPLRVSVEIGTYDYGGVTYHGCAFRHTWLLEINGGAT